MVNVNYFLQYYIALFSTPWNVGRRAKATDIPKMESEIRFSVIDLQIFNFIFFEQQLGVKNSTL